MSSMEIEGWPSVISTGKKSLLDAALAAGAPVPYQCRAGECGNCKCQLLSGEVVEQPSLASALTPQERADGYILTCRTKARSHISVRFDSALSSAFSKPERTNVTHIKSELLNAQVIQLLVTLENPVTFMPGQYYDLQLANLPARSYSPANLSGNQELEFYIKLHQEGRVSQYLAKGVDAHTKAFVTGPYGNACLSFAPQTPIVLIGGGTGIAPMLAIARHLVADNTEYPVHLFFGISRFQDAFALNVLAELESAWSNFTYHLVVSEQHSPTVESKGAMVAAVKASHINYDEACAFVAGSPGFVSRLQGCLAEMGVKPDRLFSDSFTNRNAKSSPTRVLHWLKRCFAS